ncbi:hypothetical protein CC1G_10036 [Coprinopsis cinerea okayama7|uniref:Protein ARV n=1 Tax=Coprinopsis cinerea (strain Okayama-7 / 130 / ATCC MYA-4618 / FGSC 9003) TaxID=240176 RepID=A8NUV3_COPC7|nr:hypothetical protein CC1G_10036 [Coprinopsis cinerea okayama7\|eukprot:XP_001836542.2 hypothetical protein CC1G_10036 [Coprinopsis cinerea okayama7\
MPICIFCTTATPYLYTTYESEHNLRLEECRNCKAFVDPYVEFDALTLFIDLILLKRGVFRHLLYNRGSEPRRLNAGEPKKPPKKSACRERELNRKALLLKLAGGLVLLDSYIRWCYLNPIPASEPIIWTGPLVTQFFLIFAGTLIESLAFQLSILFLTFLVLKLVDTYRLWRYKKVAHSDPRQQFTFSLIPLSLSYASLTKYFLLFLLTIWPPSSAYPTSTQATLSPTWLEALFPNSVWVNKVLHLLDDDKLDKEWLVRNVVGGMSAGFGLRVVLDDVPSLFTTLIILVGWVVKTVVSNAVGRRIGDATLRRAWRTYSIP